jgi:hypothetical protein
VNEHILTAVVRLNEAKTLLAIKPLYSSCRHRIPSFGYVSIDSHALTRPSLSRLGMNVLDRRAVRGEANSFGHNSMATYIGVIALESKNNRPEGRFLG